MKSTSFQLSSSFSTEPHAGIPVSRMPFGWCSKALGPKILSVGQLPRESRVNLKTVRYYERRGRLPKPGPRDIRRMS